MKKWISYLCILCLSITTSFPLLAEDETTSPPIAEEKSATDKKETTEQAKNNQTATNALVSKNETIYVNLSHEGKPTEIQVVNSYQVPESHTIVDYGSYKEIINLTNYATPQVTNDEIIWNLDENTQHFYYQGTLDKLELPWTFDIRYQLNGKPAKAEDLVGASGLIETFIDFTPNPNVSDYLKNNFFLQLSTSYDMSKCLSVEAPDGVIVTLGATQSITFMAMPGEETSFYIRVGSDCYESSGFNIVIAPLKMSALEEVTKLTDAKERVEDAFNAASDSLDIILDSTDSIKGSVNTLNQSLSNFKTSLQKTREGDTQTDADVNRLIAEAQSLSHSLSQLSPHFEEVDKLIKELNDTSNTLLSDMNQLTPLLQATRDAIELLQSDFINLRNLVKSLNEESLNTQDTLVSLRQSLTLLKQDMMQLDQSLQDLGNKLDDNQISLEDASESLSDFSLTIDTFDTFNSVSLPNAQYMDRFTEDDFILLQNLQSKANELLYQINSRINNGENRINSGISSANDRIESINDDIESINDAVNEGSDQASDVLYDTSRLLGSTSNLTSTLGVLSTDIATLSDSLNHSILAIESILTTLDAQQENILFSIDDINTLMITLGQATTIADLLLNDINVFQDIMNRFTKEISSLLNLSSQITLHITDTTDAATTLGAGVLNRITSNRQQLYTSIDKLLDATSYTLQDILYTLGTTKQLKENKNTIHTTIDNEWNRLDDDFNLLNYDPDATPVSLVSSKNTNVNSVQIILRTPELTIDKNDDFTYQEIATEDLTLMDRIKNILNTLVSSIYTPTSEGVD